MNVCITLHRVALMATAVAFVVGGGHNLVGAEPVAESSKPVAARVAIADLPEPISSFGAAICGDYLYIYSGHTGEAHAHSRDNLSKKFSRILLAKPERWESLPMETAMQGLPIVSDGKQVFRVGGLVAHNSPDDPDKLESLAEFSAFDPDKKAWTRRSPLPEGRSSHDAVVADGVLYVVGGWRLGDKEPVWYDRAMKINLADAAAKWEELPAQPFRRRALAVVEMNKKLYAIGGMTADAKPSCDVHVFDIKTQQWSAGPSLPGKPISGFGCGAAVWRGAIYVTTMEGDVYRLDAEGKAWQTAGKLQQARFFHRLIGVGDEALLAIGGASRQGHLKTPEWFVPPAK